MQTYKEQNAGSSGTKYVHILVDSEPIKGLRLATIITPVKEIFLISNGYSSE